MSTEAAIPTPMASATEATESTPAVEEETNKPAVPEPEPEPVADTTPAAVPEPAAEPTSIPGPAPEKVEDDDKDKKAEAPAAAASPAAPASTPLVELFAELPSIISEAGYQEMWGISLSSSDDSDVPTSIVLEKFLRANVEKDGKKNVAKAKAQLIEALKWRKKIDPAKLLAETEFDATKFGGLGYVTVYPQEGKEKEIVTWNIYGGVKDNKGTFGNVEEFVKWRAALMELSLKELDLASATARIPEDGPDPYRMVQVHDYLNVSFLRMDPTIRAASKETIQIFSVAYPELLKEKFFVNVPLVMGWVFTFMKAFLSAETVKKFHPLSYGSSLARELPAFGQELPAAYGGKGKDVKEGLTVKYASTDAPAAEVTEE